MCAKHFPRLRVVLEDSSLDIEDACKSQPHLVRETLISALLLLPVGEQAANRVQLGEAFRRSLQSERQSTPYRLHSVISACKEEKIDGASLEAKFFRHGGVHAVTALAAAAADDNKIMLQLEGLGDAELKCFLESIDTIKRHPDIQFMAEALDRKRPSITSKKTQLVRPRPSRSMKASSMENPSIHKIPQPSRHLSCRPEPETSETSATVCQWHTRHSTQVPYQNSHSEAASTENQPYAEHTTVMMGPPDFEYDGMFNTPTRNESSSTGGNYRIDLDDIDIVRSPLELVRSSTENYGINLDQLSTF
jgi:hypothetical protein